jgi:propionyl-CoA synthetase
MEEVLASHPDVAECAVVGVADELKGEVPLGLVVLTAGRPRAEAEVVTELIALVRERIGPVASFKLAMLVRRLPEDAVGKDRSRNDQEDRRRGALPGAADHR